MQALLEWMLPIIGSGGLGAAITYLFTFKSKKKQADAEAESSIIDVAHKKEDLKQD
jgi:homoserine dehydrogenase